MKSVNWLILRGLIREQRHWGKFKECFEAQVGKEHVFCLDHMGIGTEENRVCHWTIKEMVDDMRERWTKLRDANPGPWSLFAISLGGMVALDWFNRYSSDFESLVLSNSSVKPLNPFYERFNVFNVRHFPSFLFHPSKVNRERIILKMTTGLGPQELELQAHKQAEYALNLKKFRETGLRQLTAAGKFEISSNMKNLGNTRNITVLSSLKDKLVNPKCSKNIAEFLNAPIIYHEHSNHDVSLDAPEWLAETIAKTSR